MKNIYTLTLFMLLFSFSSAINAQELDFYNTQWLSDGTNGSNTSLSVDEGTTITVYSKAYEADVTDAAGQGAGIECWIGFNSADTDPASWDESAWQVANFGQDNGNDDEYNYSTSSTAVGTHYIATRWRLDSGSYTYGGASATNGGAWDGLNNNNIGLTVNAVAQPLLITTTTCASATEVRLTGPWWGWDPAGGPIAVDNGDGTWVFTFDPAPTDNMEYLLVVDGVQENLISIMANGGDCAPVTDYANYANRRWDLGSGNVTNTYGQCGTTCVAPVITLSGSDVSLNVGDTYTDDGATASDDEEGDISANIVVGGDAVDTATAGTYTITYDVSDGAGNAAVQLSRTVTVVQPAYCDSTPSSNDGTGISSVSLNGTDFTSGGDITYEDFTATPVEAGQSTNASLNITFTTGYSYDTHVWVDLNDDYNFDSSELLYSGESTNANPTTLDASFVVPSDAPLGDHRLRIGTADSGQSTPNPCYSGSYGVTVEMTITVVEPPSCLAPTALVANNVTSSSADISWTAGGTETDYEYVVQTAGTGEPTDTGTAVTGATSVLLSTLTDNTNYEVYVRSVCAVGEFSTWSGPLNFTTACAPTTSFNENFDSATTPNLPDCWSSIVSGVTSSYASVTTSTSADNSVPNGISLYNSSSLSGDIILVSPIVSNLAAGTHRLKVRAQSSHEAQDLEIGTLSDPSDSSTFTVLETLDTNTTYSEYIIDFSSYTGTDMYIGFRRLLTSTYTYVYLDDIVWEEIPSTAPNCVVNFTNTMDTTCGNFDFDISWDAADGADGYYLTAGTNSGGNDIEALTDLGNVTSYTFVNVQVSTTYYYTVIPYNANGSATGCSEQSLSTVSTGCYCDSTPSSNDGTGISSVSLNGTDFTSGGDITYEDFTATPVEAGQSTNASLNITFTTGYSYDTHVWVDLNDDYNFDSSELLYSGESTNANPTTLDASFVVPSDAPLGDHRLRIGTADSGQSTPNPCYSGSYGVTVEMTITVVEPPSCLAPTALVANNVTSSSADISWDNSSDSIDFNIEYGVNGFTLGEGTSDVANSNTYSLSDLSANTSYDVYVQLDCDLNSVSEWAGPLTITTLCDTYAVFPFVETFNTDSATASCWKVDNANGDADSWTTSYDSNTNEGDGVAAMYTDYNSGANDDWLISPGFQLTGNERLKFQQRVQSSGEPNDFEVLLSSTTAETASFTTVLLANAEYSNTAYQEIVIDLSSYTGVNYIAFHVASGGLDGWRLYIDDVVVEEIPSCLAPTALVANNVTFSGADISWIAGGTETDYEYVLQAAGVGEPTAAGRSVAGATSVSLSELSENTSYEVYVRSVCTVSEFSTWTGPLNFTTEPAPIVPTYTNDFSSYPGEFWSEGTGSLTTGPSGSSSAWNADGFANDGTTGAARVNVYYSSFSGSGNDDWLISPMFDLSNGPYYLNLNVALTGYNSTSSTSFGPDDFVSLMLTDDDGSTWTELYRWDANNVPSATGDDMPQIDLSSYNSMTKFALYAESAVGNIDNDFFVDNFQITSTSLGVEDNSISLFNYFPNPVNDVLTIKAQKVVDHITVYNMLGQVVKRQSPNTRDCTVDLSTMQTGAYFVQVSIDNTVETVRILKN